MAVTRESRVWEELFAAADARGRGRRDRGDPRLPRQSRPDLLRRRLSRPADVPGRARGGAPAELAARRRHLRVPVRADARARRARATRSPRGSSRCRAHGPPTTSCSSRAAASRRSSSSRSRSSTGATPSSSRGRRISARSWRSAASRRRSSPCRSTRTGSTSTRSPTTLAAGLRPKLLYTIPDHQNPAGVTLSRRAPRCARRARAPLRLPDRRGRRLPRARLRRHGARRASGASRPTSSCRPARRRRRSSPACGSAGRPGPPRSSRSSSSAKQNTDQCAGALGQRLFEEYARRGWIDEQLERSRALYARKCERLLAALERTMPREVEWTRPSGGFFSWLTLPVDAADLARRAVDDGVAVVPGAPSSRTAAARRTSASPSASSTTS